MRVIQICERQNMALFKKKNHRFIDIWLLIITCHNFPQQLNDGNKSVWNTWGLPTMMQSFQQYNVPRLVLCLCRTTGIASLQLYTSYVSWSQNFQWFTDDIMCPRYLTSVLNIHPTVLAHVPCSRYSPYHAGDLTSSGLTWAWPKYRLLDLCAG